MNDQPFLDWDNEEDNMVRYLRDNVRTIKYEIPECFKTQRMKRSEEDNLMLSSRYICRKGEIDRDGKFYCDDGIFPFNTDLIDDNYYWFRSRQHAYAYFDNSNNIVMIDV